MLVKIQTATMNGITPLAVLLEINSTKKTDMARPTLFIMVGQPDNMVRESRSRVESALQSCKYPVPHTNNVTVNFAPADVRKEGTLLDLPLAIGLLVANKIVSEERLADFAFIGELGLDGSLRPVKGALSIAIEMRRLGIKGLIVPAENAREAAVVNRLKVYGADHLSQVVRLLNGEAEVLPPTEVNTREEFFAAQADYPFDFSDVKGQTAVKRALEVAAAGGHNIILIGSPGCGKSMMAKRLPTILPPLTLSESLETTQIQSVAGELKGRSSLVKQRPFRAPHHTISDVALIGGGATCQPGEISLAHNGVLFLDELPEFSRSALETLRQPLEDREITIARTRYTATLPCSFMLVASMNPCPCGYYMDPTHHCHCNPGMIQRYKNKISGPLMDRIDIQVSVPTVPVEDMAHMPRGESSATIRARVEAARQIQTDRYAGLKGIHCNAQMTPRLLERYAQLDAEASAVLTAAMQRHNLSARAYNRILKVARTIADLDHSPAILRTHIIEAVGYRQLDRQDWGE